MDPRLRHGHITILLALDVTTLPFETSCARPQPFHHIESHCATCPRRTPPFSVHPITAATMPWGPKPWQLPSALTSPDPAPPAARTIPAILTRIISHYTHRSYGTHLLANLAPGIPAPDRTLPASVRELLQWHNGYVDYHCEYLDIFDWTWRLLSYERALELCRSRLEADGGDGDYWSDDVWPVFAKRECRDFVVVSRASGKAGYYIEDCDLNEDVVWFDGLYELLRAVEEAGREGRFEVANRVGNPVGIVESGREGGVRWVHETDYVDGEEEVGEAEAEREG